VGQVLPGSATTTAAVRRAIQLRQESVRALAHRYGVSPTTIQKWRRRATTADGPERDWRDGPDVRGRGDHRRLSQSTRCCRWTTASTACSPHLTRSSLHRCRARHGISRLPEIEGDKPTKKRFASYPIGYFHIDIAEVQTEEGKLLPVRGDRPSADG
jgi:hypothetical protein